MLKKTILILFLILFVGCSSDNENTTTKKENNDETYSSITIKTNLTNPESKDDYYLVYLLPIGVKETEPGKATQSGWYGPFETDENGEVVIDLENNRDIQFYLDDDDETDDANKLQVIVATKEDKYLRNPLNEETFIEFILIENGDEWSKMYESKTDEISIDITDEYPDGVYSLTFPDATFVIKLEFEEGYEVGKSFEVSIHKYDEDSENNIGIYRLGRISRLFQYYDTPFFEEDSLKDWSGTIVVRSYDTDEIVEYEGYPKTVSFTEEGKCEQGDIVTIKLINLE